MSFIQMWTIFKRKYDHNVQSVNFRFKFTWRMQRSAPGRMMTPPAKFLKVNSTFYFKLKKITARSLDTRGLPVRVK